MLNVTVTTASIPGREQLLAEAIASVNAQTVKPLAHLIRVQRPPDGRLSPVHLSHQRNQLLEGVRTPWLSILDDDDLLLRRHFEHLEPALNEDADVVYSYARVGKVAFEDVTGWSSQQLLARLERGNCISSNSTIRTGLLDAVGGWDEDGYDAASGRYPTGATWDDWDLWIRLARAGARFVCVPVPTWDYRSGSWERCVPTALASSA